MLSYIIYADILNFGNVFERATGTKRIIRGLNASSSPTPPYTKFNGDFSLKCFNDKNSNISKVFHGVYRVHSGWLIVANYCFRRPGDYFVRDKLRKEFILGFARNAAADKGRKDEHDKNVPPSART